jgi:thiol:disulfide interchange protein/DsbC/DsbD-like thiol-disulfide interchange protein
MTAQPTNPAQASHTALLRQSDSRFIMTLLGTRSFRPTTIRGPLWNRESRCRVLATLAGGEISLSFMGPSVKYRIEWAALGLLLAGTAAAQSVVEAPHVRAELLLEDTTLLADGPQWAGVRLSPEKGWHVYWQNPGDSGLATRLTWTLPDAISAGAIQWPYPHAESLGPLTNYGYSDPTLHLVPLTSSGLTGDAASLTVRVDWLVCADVCIPGHANLSLEAPVSESAERNADNTEVFRQARAQLPQDWPDGNPVHRVADGTFSLAIPGPWTAGDRVEYFPIPNDLVDHAQPQRVAVDDGVLRLSQSISAFYGEVGDTVDGVLVVQRDGAPTQAFSLSSTAGEVVAVPGDAAAADATTPASPVASADEPGLGWVLLLAFAGGLILNLMPCVFPVLSLKAMAVIRSRDQTARHRQLHALAYTAGVILSCVGIAALLLGLRAGGAAIGWGFQLQSPIVVGALAYIMFALGLSLSGLFALGGRWTGMGQTLTQAEGKTGSFFTGVLAVVVASPCTAPFMGTALGFALVQPPLTAAAVFAALGLGLASPFLLIGFIPAAAKRLPRPGAWMETFKQFMAFPLYLTAVWLVWVAGQQTGPGVMALLLGGIVLIAMAVWALSRPGKAWRVVTVVATLLALFVLAQPALRAPPPDGNTTTALQSESVYSDARFDALRAEGKTVFVNFTADWCITCKVNERTTLGREHVQQAFRDHNVTYLKGDWTRSDPAITRVLERYQRSGVPLYLVSVNGGSTQILPQTLTPDIVISAVSASPNAP